MNTHMDSRRPFPRVHDGDFFTARQSRQLLTFSSTLCMNQPIKKLCVDREEASHGGGLQSNEVWELVEPPLDRMVVGSKWLYKVKRNGGGKVE